MSAVFELDKARVRSSFASASGTYDGLAELQRSAGTTLLKDWSDPKLTGTVLDLGCGTGYLTRKLLDMRGQKQIIALDIALPMLQKARSKLLSQSNLQYICADAESLPLEDNCVDRIFSNLALQWCRNLEALFKEIRRVLKPTGKLVFSTFGPQTLNELKLAWSQVDGYTHVNQFYSERQIIEYMRKTGFQNIRTKNQLNVSGYKNVIELMKELKGIGAHNANRGRNRGLTGKARLQSMSSAYEQFGDGGCLPATFELLYLSGDAGG